MLKYKAGLHKEVSAIFNGVLLPKSNGSQQSSATPAPGHQDYSAPKPPAITSPASSPAVPKQPSTTSPAAPKPAAPETPIQKAPAPSHMTPTKPKPEQLPLQSPPKAAPAKQPKADTAVKTAGQTPWRQTLEQIKNKLFATKQGVNATRQRVMVILAPVLFIALIFVFIQVFSTPSQKITGLGTSGPVKAAAAGPNGKVDWQAPNPYPTTLRDPMQFGPVTNLSGQAGSAGLIVKGIVYSKGNPCAVIGDQIVHQGDKILDVVIIKINENSVEFEANGKKWTQKVQR